MKRCLAAAVLLSVALSGCGSSTTTPTPEPPGQLPFPATADIAMQNFMTAYEGMSTQHLATVTHPQSIIILQMSTRSNFPDVGETLDRQEQRRIAERMFSKQEVTDPNNNLVAGVQTIQFQTFQRVGNWGTSLPTDAIPNTEYALYSVQVLFDRGQSSSTIKTTGNIRFYVSHRDSTAAGVTRPYYQIIGQVDLTDDALGAPHDKPAETSAWGSVHALFR